MKSYVSFAVPRGGFRVRFQETGHEVVADHPAEWLKQCREHMEANGIPVTGGWKERLFDEMCNQHPEFGCQDDGLKQSRVVEGQDIWRFLTVLWNSVEAGAKQVSPEEQERRLALCAVCPKRGVVTCSLGCGKLAEVLSRLAIGKPAKIREDLHKTHCLPCGCEVTAKSSYPLEVLRAVDEKLGHTPDYWTGGCWMLEPSVD